MRMGEFGEVNVVTLGEKIPKGMVIRERSGTVVLEEYFDTTGQNFDVLQEFEAFVSIRNQKDLCYCIAEAREYEPDKDIPIYILTTCVEDILKEVEMYEKNKACMMCMLKWNQKHPWSMAPHIERCSKCEVINRKESNS